MARKGVLIGLLVAVLASTAWGYEPYFSNAAGQKIGTVWEGQQIYIAIKDPDKGACGIDEFPADLVIFDFKTGAYLGTQTGSNPIATLTNVVFREMGGIGSGLYFWVDRKGSSTKVTLQVGTRNSYTTIEGQTHVLGVVSPSTIKNWDDDPLELVGWKEGAWEYVDQDVLGDTNLMTDGVTPVATTVTNLPQHKATARVDFEGLKFTKPSLSGFATPGGGEQGAIVGRFENNDTLILIAADRQDERNVDQDQVKIVDTVATLTVPARVDYGCGPSCENIIIRVDDKDENLNCNEIEYVPVFVIINPGSWDQTPSVVNSFCGLMMRGGFNDNTNTPWNEPIRWYNIYSTNRLMDYEPGTPDNPWWNQTAWGDGLIKTVLFVPETTVDSGLFELNLGNLEDFQEFLWSDLAVARDYRLPLGTTFAFYYIDPNDFDDMTLGTMEVGNRPHSQSFLTDANGIPATEVRIGTGWGGLYVRVYDADANVEACCQDKVVVHICDPHNEDDSEYYVIDEISNDSGIFFTQSGIPLLPVWDAVSGYQLVFDDWRVESFNEDTIFVRYNSVNYTQAALNALGDGNPNDGFFPPAIDTLASRNQYWDVSFAKVKVYDTQVFDGTTHHMRFLNGQYQPVDTIPLSGSLYLEVTDLDQNEHPALRELVFGGWNKDAYTGDDNDRANTDALTLRGSTSGTLQDANEDSAPIWWRGGWGPAAVDSGDSDVMTPQGAVATDPYLGIIGYDDTTNTDDSISGILETVKVFMWNAQRGSWERMDLRETAVGSGIFRSTTCVLVADSRNPGEGNLASKAGDTIMAFYQDPSNHSDVSIISIKVNEGGAGGITPPTVALSVAFDKANYNPGDTVTITVTDEQYAGAMEIVGAAKPLILKTADGTELASWTQIPAVSGQPGKFRVSYVLPATVTGTITALYTDPLIASRTAQAQATVAAPVLASVSDVKPVPEVFSTSTAFTVYAQPAGAVPNKVTVNVYDLTGRNVATLTGTNTTTVSWNGGTLRNGAYIYVWTVEGGNPVQTWTGKGFVYIKR
ncbi:MAG TPA: hypothetical protein PKG50_04180 [Candidatus Bipolaricaulis anaerobius]|nr:hypothetical protein [Candidatus Bipolaricaulis anaerobius]HNS23310.1 hypothetical protein [Candidatus Bipolaricaulis anaerobius]